jgi:hypothetical protein
MDEVEDRLADHVGLAPAEHALGRRADPGDAHAGIEQRDRVGAVLDDRAEAALGPARRENLAGERGDVADELDLVLEQRPARGDADHERAGVVVRDDHRLDAVGDAQMLVRRAGADAERAHRVVETCLVIGTGKRAHVTGDGAPHTAGLLLELAVVETEGVLDEKADLADEELRVDAAQGGPAELRDRALLVAATDQLGADLLDRASLGSGTEDATVCPFAVHERLPNPGSVFSKGAAMTLFP